MSKRLQALQQKRLATIGAMQALLTAAEARGEAALLTSEEQATYDTHKTQLAAYSAQIADEQQLLEAVRSMPAARGTQITNVHDRAGDRPFESFGEQLAAIAQAGMPGGSIDPRLYGAASGASSAVGSDGGFLIQKEFGVDLMNKGQASGELASRCDDNPIGDGKNALEVVTIDETSRANGSRWGGVQVYRKSEAGTVDSSKTKLGTWERKLEDLMGLAYATDNLLEDAPAMAKIFSAAFADEMGFKLDDEIFRGTGVGQCQGIIGAPATVSQAAEGGQAADTINATNIQKMWSRVPLRSRLKGIWVYNLEAEVQLQQMQIGTGSAATLVFLPPGGISGAQYGTIYGRPAMPIEHASALGDVGDIAFLDLTQYALIRKGGVKQDESIHVRFLYNERAFRWVTRVNGAPKWKSALTPYKGTNTLSPFVTLAAR